MTGICLRILGQAEKSEPAHRHRSSEPLTTMHHAMTRTEQTQLPIHLGLTDERKHSRDDCLMSTSRKPFLHGAARQAAQAKHRLGRGQPLTNPRQQPISALRLNHRELERRATRVQH